MNRYSDTDFQLQQIINYCRGIDFSALTELLFVHESPENAPVHGIPRLSVLTKGSESFRCGSTLEECTIQAPAIYYCTRDGYLWTATNSPGFPAPHTAFSFCYMPEYIRLSWVNTFSPGDWDQTPVNIHTLHPLSPGGMALLNAFEKLYIQGNVKLARQLLDELWLLSLDEISNAAIKGTPQLRGLWSKINYYLRNNRSNTITRENTARLFNISPGYLSRLAQRYAGCEFIELVSRYKLEHAAILLQSTTLSIDEISDECGFNYRSYFDRRFKIFYGITPREYRDRYTAHKL